MKRGRAGEEWDDEEEWCRDVPDIVQKYGEHTVALWGLLWTRGWCRRGSRSRVEAATHSRTRLSPPAFPLRRPLQIRVTPPPATPPAEIETKPARHYSAGT